MIIYNVTIKVDSSVAVEWLRWMTDVHIPAMVDTGCFSKPTVLKLLELDDSEGPTYVVQYKADSMQVYDQYIDTYSIKMRNDSFERWGNKFIAFRSVMEVVN